MAQKALLDGKYLMYRGKPLVREKNAICYGSMDDKYVLFLILLTNKKVGETTVPGRVIVQVVSTDPKADPQTKIYRQCEKQGLFEAFDIGLIWLDRANSAI